ncbi:MAG: hypothetical protein LQ340_000211 [Diploschistes diacapsis]|nr:MAG: hypothetical protein LQ340_000211 [Diploschistes diacapsis]
MPGSIHILYLLALAATALAARGGRFGQKPPELTVETDWALKHLSEEHHLDNFDSGAFFTLHDFDSSGGWTPEEVRRMYGLEDESQHGLPTAKREEVTREVFKLYDIDHNGVIEKSEWHQKVDAEGVRLPDFGLGPGHHGDDEYEYEIHHFEKFHGADAKEEDLTHSEDIAHFAKHDREDEQAERFERANQKPIVEANIPAMFRRPKAA